MKKLTAIGLLLIAGWFLVFLFLPESREELPALRDHGKEMQAAYPSLSKVRYQYVRNSLQVDVFVGGTGESEKIKEDLQRFLSGDDFLEEFLAWVESQRTESDSTGLMPSYPEIWIFCYPDGEKDSCWASYTMYYTQPYRSDRTLEVDGYQTWYDN